MTDIGLFWLCPHCDNGHGISADTPNGLYEEIVDHNFQLGHLNATFEEIKLSLTFSGVYIDQ